MDGGRRRSGPGSGGAAEDLSAAPLNAAKSPFSTDEAPTSPEDVTSYNNYLRVRHRQGRSGRKAAHLKTSPWTVQVDGECVGKPGDVRARGSHQAASRSRSASIACAASKRWSMVIPWVGVPAGGPPEAGRADVECEIRRVRDACIVPTEMPGAAFRPVLEWPYVEGLRWPRPCTR